MATLPISMGQGFHSIYVHISNGRVECFHGFRARVTAFAIRKIYGPQLDDDNNNNNKNNNNNDDDEHFNPIHKMKQRGQSNESDVFVLPCATLNGIPYL